MCRKAARAGLELLSLAHHDSFVVGVGQKRTSCLPTEREQAFFKKARARPQSVLPKKRVRFEKFMVKEKCFVLGMHKLA